MALNKRKVLDAARKHAQKGAKAKALKEYNKLLKEDPRDAKLLLEVGDAYRRWGQNDEAIAQYNKVAAQYRQDGFDARAVAVFKQILNLDSKNYGAYVSLSELYQRMGLDSEAISALQTAADGYHKEGRKTEALELLRQMASLDPTNTTSRLKVAELLRQEGMEDEAVDEYQAVVGELESQQDGDQLINVLERILELRPDDVASLTRLVRQLMTAGELPRAEPLAVRARDVAEDVPQYELLMDLYAQMGDETRLAEATRGLAKLHRERGDEEKARELMQRLPVEEVGSGSRLAVDVSEVAEPEIAEEELLDDEEPFLSLGDDDTPAAGEDADAFTLEEAAPEIELEAPAESAAPASEALPVPEGDPDQLLAEASVYLRYGKRDQAIASLRGVLAQEPEHRGALEKLGEAYAEDGQNAEAVQAWLQAAAQVRRAGDADALEVLRDRIAALDPASAAQVGEVEAGAAAPDADAAASGAEPTQPAVEFDLDVEVDLDLDGAIDEVAASETQVGPGVASAQEELEFELEDASDLSEGPGADAAEDAPSVDASEELELELDLSAEFESEGFAADEGAGAADVTLEDVAPDEESTDEASAGPALLGATGDLSSATSAQVQEELEEAEFYLAQEMFDEAESILQRVLEIAPNHPAAMLRLGEVAAARGDEPDSAVGGGAKATQELTSRFGDDETIGDAEAVSEADAGAEAEASDDETEDGFDLDLDFDDDEPDLAAAAEAAAAALGDDEAEDSTAALAPETPEPVVEIEDEALSATDAEPDETPAAVEPKEAPAPEPVVADPPEPMAAAPEQPEATDPGPESPMDAGETFDLREALADVLAEDEEPAADPSADSGVLSTVEDGFESIFSDFKKGVSAQLEEDDYDTRYDLGIAYREMGLFDDAIAEFRVCLDSEARRFDSLYLMGLCARDLSRFDDAVNHLQQALALPDLPEERLAGVYFDLATAEEGAGRSDRAIASLRRVVELDAGFPGAAERLAALESGEPGAPDVGEPGDGFESFDDLFDDDDAAGDAAVDEVSAAETFESFDDVVSEAEAALDEAEDETGAEPAEDDDTQSSSRRGGRKKISFV